MNKRYVMKTIAELQYDLENDYTETKLFDDISRAENCLVRMCRRYTIV